MQTTKMCDLWIEIPKEHSNNARQRLSFRLFTSWCPHLLLNGSFFCFFLISTLSTRRWFCLGFVGFVVFFFCWERFFYIDEIKTSKKV